MEHRLKTIIKPGVWVETHNFAAPNRSPGALCDGPFSGGLTFARRRSINGVWCYR